MAEIVPVVSEALEAQIRNLLPSQRGFGEDLQASNVITPIIDLTQAALGTTTPEYLQTALAFGSQTEFFAANSTDLVVNTPGFFRIIGTSSLRNNGGSGQTRFNMTDGLTSKDIWEYDQRTAATNDEIGNISVAFDFIVFLRSGESVSAISNKTEARITGSSRPVADVNGNLIYPVGFTPQ